MNGNLFEEKIIPLVNAGRTTNCQRCNRACKVAGTANKNARPARHADGTGLCPDCVITSFLKEEINIESLLPKGTEAREALRLPHIQGMFQNLLLAGKSDLKASEINWERIIELWDLPLPKVVRKRRGK